MPETRKAVIAPGEPTGIGPDLAVQLAQRDRPVESMIYVGGALLTDRVQRLGLPLSPLPYDPTQPPVPQRAGTPTLLNVPLGVPAELGVLNVQNGAHVAETPARAYGDCLSGGLAALVIGLVHKGNISDAGIVFTGYTEFFEERAKVNKAVVMLVTEELRAALVTTHLLLRAISGAVTSRLLREIITIFDHDLCTKFGIVQSYVLVCGLSPHAGEDGHMGMEEIDTIIPVLEEMRAKGTNLSGPLSTDTLFQPKYLGHVDAVLVMYHDQDLPVLKYQGLGRGVNVTLGLPFIRTSAGHGTALELAGQGKADVGSFIAAPNLVIEVVVNAQ